MLLIAGTVPVEDFPLTVGEVAIDGEYLLIGDRSISCAQGTGAMLSAAVVTVDHLGTKERPIAVLAGDCGDGSGSRTLYRYLIDHLRESSPQIVALHYLLPVISLMGKLVAVCREHTADIKLVADAGSMYAAKAAGLSKEFTIMTPDAGEMAFLVDPDATHPAYIARHFFNDGLNDMPAMIRDAYSRGDVPQTLLVKGKTDLIASDGQVIASVTEPDIPPMEAIGGTGDIITGMVSAFLDAGLEPHKAAVIAAKANRMAGKYASARPDTRVAEVVMQLSSVFRDYLCEWSGVCNT